MKTPTTLLLPTLKSKNLAIAAQTKHLILKLKDLGAQVILFDTQSAEPIFTPDYMLTVSPHDIIIGSLPEAIKNENLEQSIILATENEGYLINDVTDFSGAGEEELYLYGASGVLIDQQEKVAYCMISKRADEDLLIELCEEYQMQPVIFHCDKEFEYTTQVLMLGKGFALVAMEAFSDKAEMKDLIESIKQSSREIIKISAEQARNFVTQSINIIDSCGKSHLLLSQHAYATLTDDQKQKIQAHSAIHHLPFDAVETLFNRGLSSLCLPIYLEKE